MNIWNIIALGLIGLCAATITVEIVLRRWTAQSPHVWLPHRRLKILNDPTVTPGYDEVAWTFINCDGERGSPPPKDWRGVYRGLVMGGSTAECYGLSQQNSWPEILRCELSRPENLKKLGVGSVHIGNLGRSETPIAAQIQILEAIRSRYSSLDLIVFLVGASDAVGWLHQGAPGDRGVELMSGKRIFARESHGFEGNWRALAIKQITSQACRQIFRKYDLISNFSSRVARRQKRRQAATIVLDEVPNATALLDQWEADFLRLAILARSLARRVIFIQRAWFDGVSSSAAECHFWHGALGAGEEGDSPGPYLSVKALSSLMSLIAARSEALTKQHGIEILKVGAPITEDLNNYCDQFHFSVRGARLVAGRIAAQILASGE